MRIVTKHDTWVKVDSTDTQTLGVAPILCYVYKSLCDHNRGYDYLEP